jgi:hypothetical protein
LPDNQPDAVPCERLRKFYQKINGSYIKAERLHSAGESLEVEVYGWLDTTLICRQTSKRLKEKNVWKPPDPAFNFR